MSIHVAEALPVTQSDDPFEVVVRGFWKPFPTVVLAPNIPFLHPPSPRDALESAFEGAGDVERVAHMSQAHPSHRAAPTLWKHVSNTGNM